MLRIRYDHVVATNRALDRLQNAGRPLPSSVREALLADRVGLVAELAEALSQGRFHRTSAVSDGWGPVHAVELLVEIGTPEAIDALVNAYLQQIAPEGPLRTQIVKALAGLGPAVLEPALAAFRRSRDQDDRRGLCEILAHIGMNGARDERIFEALRKHFESDRVFGGLALYNYGDPRGRALVKRAAEDRTVSADDRFQLELFLHAMGPQG